MTGELFASAKRVVVKVGTSVLTESGRTLVSRDRVEGIASEVAELWRQGREIVVVTSGAIGVGMGILNLRKRPAELEKLQAAAAIGQGRLLYWYAAQLERQGYHAAQILLTRDDLENRRRYVNAKATLRTLLNARAVPIINENDTVSVEEIRYGDNDILSAHVAALVDADLLVLLTDVDGLRGPEGLKTPLVTAITPDLERAAGGTAKSVSTGGMRTKLEAARIAMASGIPMVLLNGLLPKALVKTLLGKEFAGTVFLPKKEARFKGKQRWLALTGKPKGILFVDAGAREALVHQGRSLLASGVCGLEGSFHRGDLVSVSVGGPDQQFARGLAGYSHSELAKIMGFNSQEITRLLGRKANEVIHRDSLVILRG